MYQYYEQEWIDDFGGLDYMIKDAEINRSSIDKFICRPVDMVNMTGVADVVLCFAFSPNYDVRKKSFIKMAEFLKPDGTALYDLSIPGRLACKD